MCKNARFATVFTLLLLSTGLTLVAAGSGEQYVPEQLLVKFEPTMSDASIDRISSPLRAGVESRFRSAPGLRLIKLARGASVKKAIDYYEAQPGVIRAEPNYLLQIQDNPVIPLIPNDPLFPHRWGLHNTGQQGGLEGFDIDAPEAWFHQPPETVVVGILDTGVDIHHEDLRDNLWVNAAEINGRPLLDDDDNGLVDDFWGWDFIDDDNAPHDDGYGGSSLDHGTHVAGIVAAEGNNAKGVAGVDWQARIMAIRVCGFFGCPVAKIIKGLDYATEMGARVTNNSYGGGCQSIELYEAIERARDAGILTVAAAGNNSRDIDHHPICPASYDIENIIAVASMDRQGHISSFSNYGDLDVDLGAPGEFILSTLPDHTYGFKDGTSMAAPFVAGAAAYLTGFPEPAGQDTFYVKDLILESVEENPDLRYITASGGVLNLRNALDRLFELYE